jgi:Lar family restriction alleviation protein
MAEPLKPCPFCGSTDVEQTWTDDYLDDVQGCYNPAIVYCGACHASGPYASRKASSRGHGVVQEACDLWNARKTEG